MTLVVRGMRGLGDNIYQRVFIKSVVQRDGEVYLQTPWPELYEDIGGVRFLRDSTPLRTQSRNIAAQSPARWSEPPRSYREIRVSYGHSQLRQGSIVDAMRACFRVEPAAFDLPAFASPIRASRPVAMVRPATERKEWHNAARNPLPEYVCRVASYLTRDYHIVSVADLQDGAEWLVGDEPPAHQRFHRGELGVRELLGLVHGAAVVVGGVGWIVPAAIAARVPLFCILGGQGSHNAPAKITDPTTMRLDRARFAEPDNYCRCDSMRHECDKRNSRLVDQWATFRRECLL